MRFSASGLVDGGIECGYEEEDGSTPTEIVFEIGQWLTKQIGDLISRSEELTKEKGLKASATRKILIGSLQNPFAQLSVYGNEIIVTYKHPGLMKRQGFMVWFPSFESTKTDAVVEDFLNQLRKVDPLEP